MCKMSCLTAPNVTMLETKQENNKVVRVSTIDRFSELGFLCLISQNSLLIDKIL